MINICFHGIGTPRRILEPNEENYWISADLYLQIVDEVRGRPDVALSFDDGNASDFDIGLEPLLRASRAATFFVLAARLDQEGSLTSDHVRELRRNGMKIGSHGMNHVPWRHLSAEQQQQEFSDARDLIADVIEEPVREAALPLGRYDRSVLSCLRRLGYVRVFSSDRAHTRPSAWLQPRFSVHASDTIETVRSEILAAQSRRTAITFAAKGLLKRWR